MGIPNEDEIKGKYDRAKGNVKEKIGEITNDPETIEEGRRDQASGEVRENVGRARRKVGETVEEIGKKIGR
jgi:uncharacterized protein YjbJ (UPF0337 family)